MIEASVVTQADVERAFAGVPEWRVAEVMRKRQRLSQILVETERLPFFIWE